MMFVQSALPPARGASFSHDFLKPVPFRPEHLALPSATYRTGPLNILETSG